MTDDPLAEFSRQLDAIPDDGERAAARTRALGQIRRLQDEQKAKRQTDVQKLHKGGHGLTFAEIGRLIGVTRGRAKQIHDGDSTNHGQRQHRRGEAGDGP